MNGTRYVATTYRRERNTGQTGVMTRHLPWLLEMQMPQMFVEMGHGAGSGKRHQERRHGSGDICQGQLSCVAIVTDILKPFKIMDTTVQYW